jgi:PAS domain S-box-containing protein
MQQDQAQLQLKARNAALERQVQDLQRQLSAPMNPAAAPQGIVANFKILFQKLARTLQLSEARYSALTAQSPDSIVRCTPDRRITFANATFCNYFQCSADTIVGTVITDCLVQDGNLFVNRFEQALERLNQAADRQGEKRDQAAAVAVEQRCIRAGQVRWQQWTPVALYDRRGRLFEYQIVGRDITDRKQLETWQPAEEPQWASHPAAHVARLENTIDQLQTELLGLKWAQAIPQLEQGESRRIIAALSQGILVVDRQGRVQTCNASAADRLETTQAQLIGEILWGGMQGAQETQGTQWQLCQADGSPFTELPTQLTAQTGIACVGVVVGLQPASWPPAQPPNQIQPPHKWQCLSTYPLFNAHEALPYAVVVSLGDLTLELAGQIVPALSPARLADPVNPTQALLSTSIDASQPMVRQILESITDGFVAFDADWRFTYINHEAARTIGRSGKSLLGKVIWLEFPQFAETGLGQLYRQAQDQQTVIESVEYYGPCDRWYSVRLYPTPTGLSLYFRNLTPMFQTVHQRDMAEDELRDSEERFRQLAENIPQIFWMYDLDEQRLSYISPASEAVLGYDSQNCYDKTWSYWQAAIHPDDLPQVVKASRQPRRGKSAEVEYRFAKPDGTLCWLRARAFPVRNAQGQVYRVAGIAEDITALKQQQADRQQQESWLRLLESVIINANDAVVITEAEPVQLPGPHIVYVNQAFSRMMGYSPEEVIGKTPRILQGPKTSFDILQSIREALKAWKPVLAELINYHKDGSEVWVELSIFPVEDRTGRYKYWVGIQRDITNRKQAEAEVQKALAKERELSELKSRFVSTTSHEFRTPLSTILSSADLLEFYAGRCTPEKQHEHIQRIQIAALNMNELLNDILVIERAEAHKLQFDPVDLDLRDFCQGLVNELRLNDHGAHPLSFTVQRHDGIADPTAPIGVHMDEKLIRQILGNLLSNALKYSPIGMPVDCRLRCSDSEITLEVHDQGIGVRPEDVERLFEAFHRGTNVGAISGNGLGLAIVKQSVEAHQGEIAVQSLIGKGTIMRVRLPRWATVEARSDAPRSDGGEKS